MLALLDVAYADARAGQLSWRLGGPPRPVLARLVVPVDGGSLELGVLGASHQALVRVGATGCSEVVACDVGAPGPLPARTAREVAGGRLRYRFSCAVRRLAPAALAAESEALVERLTPDPDALVGIFPGSAHAATALAARPGRASVAWRTWHVYPGTGEVVATASEVAWR